MPRRQAACGTWQAPWLSAPHLRRGEGMPPPPIGTRLWVPPTVERLALQVGWLYPPDRSGLRTCSEAIGQWLPQLVEFEVVDHPHRRIPAMVAALKVRFPLPSSNTGTGAPTDWRCSTRRYSRVFGPCVCEALGVSPSGPGGGAPRQRAPWRPCVPLPCRANCPWCNQAPLRQEGGVTPDAVRRPSST